MSHAFVKNHIHLVFSTKDRQPAIGKDVQPELWSYLAGICRNQKMAPIAVNGMSDHAHSFSLAAHDCAGQGRSTSRIWRIQRERLEYSNRGEICPQPGAASPQDDV